MRTDTYTGSVGDINKMTSGAPHQRDNWRFIQKNIAARARDKKRPDEI